MKKTVPISKSECCGCTACVDICPKSAISMEKDCEGFFYPKVDEEKCINCGLCTENCAFSAKKREENPHELPDVALTKHKDLKVRMNSRSGGIFVALSDWILEQNGVVYGCILSDEMTVRHSRAASRDERDRMCKSKYVQSNISGIFVQVRKDLEDGKTVLFSGTGCQADSLLTFLKFCKTDTSELYTVDIVCHGCVSPEVFKDYIYWLQKKYKGEVTQFEFRNKSLVGWEGHVSSVVVNNRVIKDETYERIFSTDLCIRPSCYVCKYTSVKRNTDITIGDAWGIKKANAEFNDNRGVSLVMLHSEKGKNLFDKVKGSSSIIENNIIHYLQPNLKAPAKPKGDRDEFWRLYNDKGFDEIVKKYGKRPLYKKIKLKVKYLSKKMLYGHKLFLP